MQRLNAKSKPQTIYHLNAPNWMSHAKRVLFPLSPQPTRDVSLNLGLVFYKWERPSGEAIYLCSWQDDTQKVADAMGMQLGDRIRLIPKHYQLDSYDLSKAPDADDLIIKYEERELTWVKLTRLSQIPLEEYGLYGLDPKVLFRNVQIETDLGLKVLDDPWFLCLG